VQDSNQFHAVCLDTYPPIFYLNDTSKKIIDICHKINAGPEGAKVPAGRSGCGWAAHSAPPRAGGLHV
jgi:hypothetical protein